MTVGQRLNCWLAGRRGPAVSTMRGYAAHVRLYLKPYLKPYLGSVLLAELTVGQVQAMFTAIARRSEAEGHPVTAATPARIRATLRVALNAAIRHGHLSDNPACRIELRAAVRPRAVVWTATRIEHWKQTGAAGGRGVDRGADG